VQILLGAAEWSLTLLTTAAIQVNYFGTPLRLAVTPQQVVLTLLVVWVVPTLASCWLEQTGLDAPSRHCKGTQQEPVPLALRCVHAISRWYTQWRLRQPAQVAHTEGGAGPAAGPHQSAAAPKQLPEQQQQGDHAGAPSCSSGPQHAASMRQDHRLSSSTLPSAAANVQEQALPSPPAGGALADAAAKHPVVVQQVPPAMSAAARQEVAQYMHGAARQQAQGRVVLAYQPMCCVTPVSVKVRLCCVSAVCCVTETSWASLQPLHVLYSLETLQPMQPCCCGMMPP
jgi:hypothetical protein